MANARIAARTRALPELEPGEYCWCRRDPSRNQPWCGGSHKITEFQPMPVHIIEKKRCALCRRKRSGTEPFCGGTHRTLPVEG